MTTTKWGNNKDANKFQLLNFVLQHILGDHADAATDTGLVWFDSSGDVLKYSNSTGAQTVGTATGGDADTLGGQNGAYYLSRTNHTGTQLAATISNLAAIVKAYRLDEFAAPTAAVPLNSQKITGLANGTVSSDAAAFGQIATAIADLASETYVDDAILALTTGAPTALDTLNELAAAIGDDANFASTVTTALGQRARIFSQDVGDGTSTNITVTHNLGTRDVIVQVYVKATNGVFEPDVDRATTNTIILGYGIAPATNAHRVVIQGNA